MRNNFVMLFFNVDQWFKRRCNLKIFLVKSSCIPLCNFGRCHLKDFLSRAVGHHVQRSRTIMQFGRGGYVEHSM